MKQHAIRGQALTFSGNPFLEGIEKTMCYESDAIIGITEGRISHFGPSDQILPQLPPKLPIHHYPKSLITAGFIDCHVHYPQTPMIASHGKHLLEWLTDYTFPTEAKFSSLEWSREVAQFYLRECLRNGITTAMVYCTVHPESVQGFFEESEKRNMRNIAGKVLMDRHAPEPLLESAQKGYDQSTALIARWHQKGRQLYAITPRFAPTSSPEQLEMTAALWKEHPGTFLQTHLSETLDEVRWVNKLFPNHKDYLHLFEDYGLLAPRAVYGHGIHLSESEMQRLYQSGAALCHCPTSNLFLGSGLFHLAKATQSNRPVRVGLGTDLGAGTSFSPLQTLNEAYKIALMHHFPLRAPHSFYLATRGGAQALYLEDTVGSLAVGMEADLVVLDLHSTPLIDYRMQFCDSLEEVLFVQMMLGDDRAVKATYVAGEQQWNRDCTD